MTRSGAAAVLWAKNKGSWRPSGMCQQFTRSAFDVGAYYGSASLAWRNAKKKHPVTSGSQVPAGVPVFWTGGSRGFGHAAVSIGGGLCRSTDWPTRYNVGTARIDDITRNWGLHLAGWTEDINTVTVVKGGSVEGVTLDLSSVIYATKRGIKLKRGVRLKKAVAAEVGRGDMDLSNGILGDGFKEQYKKVQKKFLVTADETKVNVDGIPGMGSLSWLGKHHGFGVKA